MVKYENKFKFDKKRQQIIIIEVRVVSLMQTLNKFCVLTHFSRLLQLTRKPVIWFASNSNDWFLYAIQQSAETS